MGSACSPVLLPRPRFPRQRELVVEPFRRVGLVPANQSTHPSAQQATHAVAEASGAQGICWFYQAAVGALDLMVQIVPERASQEQHEWAWVHGVKLLLHVAPLSGEGRSEWGGRSVHRGKFPDASCLGSHWLLAVFGAGVKAVG